MKDSFKKQPAEIGRIFNLGFYGMAELGWVQIFQNRSNLFFMFIWVTVGTTEKSKKHVFLMKFASGGDDVPASPWYHSTAYVIKLRGKRIWYGLG